MTSKRHFFSLIILILLALLFNIKPLQAENNYVFVEKLKKVAMLPSIYKNEQQLDFFNTSKCPAQSFKVFPFDLNNDGIKELFVSNPSNNGLYSYFWRIYKQQGKKYNQIGEMACTSIRISKNITNNYMDIDCYIYRSLAEGYIVSYKFFGNEYYYNDRIKVDSKDYYCDYPDTK